MPRILSDDEIRAIRERLDRRDPRVGPGYTWDTIAALCDTVDALRRLLAGRARAVATREK